MPTGMPVNASGKSSRNRNIIANICVLVFIFPGQPAAITWPPCSTNNKRRPVTANSLETIIATIQAGASDNSIKKTKAVMTNILSARGSANLPKLETTFIFLAKYPSNQSVKLATEKTIAAINSLRSIDDDKTSSVPNSNGNIKIIINTGIKNIRKSVILLGKFIIKKPPDS